MARLFAVLRTRGPAWDGAKPMEAQDGWPEHAEFMDDLVTGGFVALGGPLDGGPDVLLVARAQDEAKVRARLAADPWTEAGLLRVLRIDPWTLRLGSFE